MPPAHRKFVRTTNLIERSFEEQRRRTNVKLAYAALQRAADRWQKVAITELEQHCAWYAMVARLTPAP